MTDEKAFLDRVAATYRTEASAQDRWMRQFVLELIEPMLGPTAQVLEMGCSDGWLTEQLSTRSAAVLSVEGAAPFVDRLRARALPNVEVRHALFEDFDTPRRFDVVVLSYVLEHVVDPVALLAKAGGLLAPGGTVVAVVPNAKALSRQLAVACGFLTSEYQLTPNDDAHGHRRVYDAGSLGEDARRAGLHVRDQGGIFLKLLSDMQLDQLYESRFLTDTHVRGLAALGQRYPELCGSLYLLAGRS
ncbi:MAG: class I SAM-dependent methyltransferase [Aquabacterium sp.]